MKFIQTLTSIISSNIIVMRVTIYIE